MKKMIIIAGFFLLQGCSIEKIERTIEITYSNGDIDTLEVVSSGAKPYLNGKGCFYDPGFMPSGPVACNVRSFKILSESN